MNGPDELDALLEHARVLGVLDDPTFVVFAQELAARQVEYARRARLARIGTLMPQFALALKKAEHEAKPELVRLAAMPQRDDDRLVFRPVVGGVDVPGASGGLAWFAELALDDGRRKRYGLPVNSYIGFTSAEEWRQMEPAIHAGVRREMVVSAEGADFGDLRALGLEPYLDLVIRGLPHDTLQIVATWWLRARQTDQALARRISSLVARNGSLLDLPDVASGQCVIDGKPFVPWQRGAEAA